MPALVSVAAAWLLQLPITCWLFTHSRTPSSDTVVNVYVPVTGAMTSPVHRTEKLSAGRPDPGVPELQLKFTVGSTRVTSSDPNAVPLKYSPRSPAPLVVVVLTVTVRSSLDVSAPSETLNRNTYAPAAENVALVMSAAEFPNVTVPGPLTLLHTAVSADGVGCPSSFAMPANVTDEGSVTVLSAPAFTAGAVLEGGSVTLLLVTVMTSVAVFPAASRALTVIVLAFAASAMPLMLQLVVPVAVPLPPRSLTQVTCVTPTSSLAVPASVIVDAVVVCVAADVGPVM